MCMTQKFNQFLILIYKGLLLRRRHYIVTVFEIVIPLLVASIPVVIIAQGDGPTDSRGSTSFDYEGENGTTVLPFNPYTQESSLTSTIWFLYTPNETSTLFNEALNTWKARAHPEVSEVYSKGFDTEEELEDAALTLISNNTVFGTVFSNFPKDGELPSKLSYKIRYGEYHAKTFHTESKFHFNDGPGYDNAYRSTAFLSWQAAVEQAFISMKSNKTIDSFDVIMQRFPYPPYPSFSLTEEHVLLVCKCFMHSFIIFFCILVKRVTHEKENRTRELQKMMGLCDCNYWISTFFNFFLLGLIIILIISIMYTTPLPNKAQVLEKTDFFLLFAVLLLYLASSILYCLAITTVFNRPNIAVTVTLILIVVPQVLLFTFYSATTFKTKFFELSLGNKLNICLLPYGALQIIFMMFSVKISLGEEVDWSTLESFSGLPDLSITMVMAVMLFSCVIYSFIICCMDVISLWSLEYGILKPFYFMCTKSYWCGRVGASKESIEMESQLIQNTEYFEKDPTGTNPTIDPGIVIKNLTKVFKSGAHSKVAVDGISLNIYSGQIVALLGRNGAGKTTTISLLTGLLTPNSGSASINWKVFYTEKEEVQESLGICPQENILFPELTVEQHMKLIAGIKGVKLSKVTSEAEKVMELVNLTDKRSVPAQSLSGEMKRKLCFGLAIIGNSKVLLLDEPTSGMDSESRRMMWDIILKTRRRKIIVLTTHDMEEADMLGDRIAIMVNGKIRCCGSPRFLRRKFGTGYHLNAVRSQLCDTIELTSFLKEHVPDTTLEDSSETDVKYAFPSNVCGRSFASMFRALESKKSEFGITSFGMTITTMDDILLKFNGVDEAELSRSIYADCENESTMLDDNNRSFYIQTKDLESGFKLWISCILGIFLKRFAYFKRHWSAVKLQIVVPFCIMCFFLFTLEKLKLPDDGTPPPLALDLGSVYGPSKGIYKSHTSTETLATEFYVPLLMEHGVKVTQTDNPEKYILDYGKKDFAKYLKHLLVGGSSNSSSSSSTLNVTAWYNGEPYHTLPISLNLMHTAILRFLTGNNGASISLTNAPLPIIHSQSKFDPMLLQVITCCFIPLALGFMSGSYILVAIQECASKAKLLQRMTGMSAFTYWFGMFLWDMVSHSVASILLLVPFAIFAASTYFVHFEAIGTILLLLLFFGWSSIPLSYILSRWIKTPSTGYLVVLCLNTILGFIASQGMSALSGAGAEESTKFQIALFFLHLLPIFSVSYGFAQLMVIALKNAGCESIPPKMLHFYCSLEDPPKNAFSCCEKDVCGDKCFTPTLPIAWDKGCGQELLFLVLDGLLYFSILLFLETGTPARFFEFIDARLPWKQRNTNSTVFVAPASDMDTDVMEEAQRIENSDPRNATEEALVTTGLTKDYGNLRAVDHLTFAVHKQECFGLLGVNGAGKTSTFMMLTGDIRPTEGNAFIDGYSIQTELKKFQSFLGYCPQSDALIDRLTAREMLKLFATIRGIPAKSRDSYVNRLIIGTDLQEDADKQTRFYSSGNKRKLSLALALVGSPPLILLDEPTSGVDPVSRRKIWHILAQAKKVSQAAFVLCTHSMEECEALCSRLSLMVKGQFRCLGSIQHLKSKFGKGFTVVLKLKNKKIIDHSTIDGVKRKFTREFPLSSLKEFHQGAMIFHIPDPSVPWSRLFSIMENIKQLFRLEDYFISGTTLEQIFLAFAPDQ